MNVCQKNIFLLSLVLYLSGCAKLSHLQELLTLQSYSDEKDRQNKYVEARDQQFDVLCREVKDGTVAQARDRQAVRRRFGDPVLVKNSPAPSKEEIWLYRYQAQWLGSPKVYLTFDEAGLLKSWRYVSPAADKAK